MDDGARVGELGGLALASAAAHRLRQQGIEEGQGFVEEVRDKRYEVMLHPDADLPEVTIGLQSVLADWFEGRAGSTERLAVAHDTAMNHGLYDVDISEPPFAGKPAELLGLAEGLGNVLTVSEALVENGFVDTYRPDETSLGTELARGYDTLVEVLDKTIELDGSFVPEVFELWSTMRGVLCANLPEKYDKQTKVLLQHISRRAEFPNSDIRKASLGALIRLQQDDPDSRRYKRQAARLVRVPPQREPSFTRDAEEYRLYVTATNRVAYGPASIFRYVRVLEAATSAGGGELEGRLTGKVA